eukprot:Nk52_evm22s490 gene=Nk52_evmTU22s490
MSGGEKLDFEVQFQNLLENYHALIKQTHSERLRFRKILQKVLHARAAAGEDVGDVIGFLSGKDSEFDPAHCATELLETRKALRQTQKELSTLKAEYQKSQDEVARLLANKAMGGDKKDSAPTPPVPAERTMPSRQAFGMPEKNVPEMAREAEEFMKQEDKRKAAERRVYAQIADALAESSCSDESVSEIDEAEFLTPGLVDKSSKYKMDSNKAAASSNKGSDDDEDFDIDKELTRGPVIPSGTVNEAELESMLNGKEGMGALETGRNINEMLKKSSRPNLLTSSYHVQHEVPKKKEWSLFDWGGNESSKSINKLELSKRFGHCISHQFKEVKFFKPRACSVCKEKIGFQKKGSKCTSCEIICHTQCSPIAPPFCGLGNNYNTSRMEVFGVPLSELLVTERQEYNDTDVKLMPNVPLVVHSCISQIEARGLCTQGIYRVAGPSVLVDALRNHFLYGLPDFQKFDQSTICSCLKQFLRELPEPLLTRRLYSSFLSTSEISEKERRSALIELCAQLPRPNICTLRLLLSHLRNVAENSQQNRMTVKNLSLVFGPILLRNRSNSVTLDLMKNDTACIVVESLMSIPGMNVKS